MNDRELLELAAKAAGVDGGWGERVMIGDDEVDLTEIWFLDNPANCAIWDPLTDDGDALRLAVGLHLLIDTDNCCAMHISKSGKNHDDWADGELEDDHLAATRRAIVRAAAAIGEAAHGD